MLIIPHIIQLKKGLSFIKCWWRKSVMKHYPNNYQASKHRLFRHSKTQTVDDHQISGLCSVEEPPTPQLTAAAKRKTQTVASFRISELQNHPKNFPRHYWSPPNSTLVKQYKWSFASVNEFYLSPQHASELIIFTFVGCTLECDQVCLYTPSIFPHPQIRADYKVKIHLLFIIILFCYASFP